MITTHATANYRDDLYAFLGSDRIEGFRQDPYFDSKGLATIGVGFNIEGDANVRRYVLNQLGVFAGQPDQEIENRQRAFEQTILGVTNGDEVDLVIKLNAKLREYLGAQTTTLFTLDQTQSRAIFEQILGDPTNGESTIGSTTYNGKQKGLDAILGGVLGGPSAHNTKEYIALMSLYYNQQATNPLIGPNTKLMSALQQDMRAEAWCEIRYQSNGGASRSEGIANRRIAESNLFSLYDNAGLGVGEAEAKAVLRMYTTHRDAILDYEIRFGTQFPASGTDTIQFQLIGAKTTLIPLYAHGFTIDGEVLVGQDAEPTLALFEPLKGTSQGDLLFGEGGTDRLEGRSGADVLYGGDGFDTLEGGIGDDWLEGGEGLDTYVYNTGDGHDRIEDSDASGVILVNGQMLIGGVKKAGHTDWESADGTIKYEMSGTDLLVKLNGLTILTVNENFQSGQLGIRLINAARERMAA